MPDEFTIRQLHRSLFRVNPDGSGSAAVDANIASTLGLSALNYTSNDSNAQLLLPAGWTWTGVSSCVRTVDSASLNRNIFMSGPGAVTIPDALKRCITAMEARLADLIQTMV
jgi:hypothetical protein